MTDAITQAIAALEQAKIDLERDYEEETSLAYIEEALAALRAARELTAQDLETLAADRAHYLRCPTFEATFVGRLCRDIDRLLVKLAFAANIIPER